MIASTAIIALILATGCAAIRILRGPTLADRILALDVALISLMAAIATHGANTGSSASFDLLIVVAIVGFTATVAASRFIEHEDAKP